MLRAKLRKILKIALALCAIYLSLSVIGGIVVAESSLRLQHRPLTHRQEAAARVRQEFQAELQDVRITAADSIVLKAWYVHPQIFNGSTVVLMHGITDNREGVAGYAELFLAHGYAVLLPDARGHGESGGQFATYGIKEADDLHRWISWLFEHDRPHCVYGFGESYGAALVLQSLASEPRYCAVVVEDSFSTAKAMSYERVSDILHVGLWFGRTIGRPIVAAADFYSRARYGIDLLSPSPLDAIKHSSVPVLLIHGALDRSIDPHHSVILADAAPDHVQLWLVPNAWHTGAWSAAHDEFESRVLGWFSAHGPAPGKLKSRRSQPLNHQLMLNA
ncbi:MAG TPA: alpha/beta fold hydrolase [Candidatus Angelobacter sp.]